MVNFRKADFKCSHNIITIWLNTNVLTYNIDNNQYSYCLLILNYKLYHILYNITVRFNLIVSCEFQVIFNNNGLPISEHSFQVTIIIGHLCRQWIQNIRGKSQSDLSIPYNGHVLSPVRLYSFVLWTFDCTDWLLRVKLQLIPNKINNLSKCDVLIQMLPDINYHNRQEPFKYLMKIYNIKPRYILINYFMFVEITF